LRNEGTFLTGNKPLAKIGVGSGVLIPPNRRASWISTAKAGRDKYNSTEEMRTEFEFLNPCPLADGDLRVILSKTTPADPVKRYVPGYEFEMRQNGSTVRAGAIRLRIGRTRPLIGWCGHIGYEVDEKYRGRRYAARSCLLVFPIAYAHGLRTIWITCDPKNIASRRTCEIAGGEYVDTVSVPRGTEMYAEGKRCVRRYRFNLKKLLSNQAMQRTCNKVARCGSPKVASR
jgi:tagatose 1,6-diphosphate aldolase